MRRNKNNSSGMILVDILVALSLGALFVILIAQSSETARDVFEFARERSRLLDVYQVHAAEFEGMMPYESRNVVAHDSIATTTMNAYAHWYGNDRIQTDISVISDMQSVELNAVRAYPFSNVNDAAGTPLCSVDFSGNTKTVSITPIVLPIDPLLPLTDIEVRNGFAFVSSDSSKTSDPDIFIFDIRDPKNVDMYIDVSTGPGLGAIALVGNHLFAANRSTTAQLQVIRIPHLGGILIDANYKLPLPYATATAPYASSIFYDKSRIYLGTEKWDGEEFSIIDVSDPSKPNKVGGLEIGSKVNDIFVRDSVAYVATSDERQLRAIDIKDPTHAVELQSFNPSGWERQEGKTITYFEDVLNLGRTSGGFNVKKDHELFSWPRASSTLSDFSSIDIAGGVYGIISDRSHLFVATRQVDHELQIFDRTLSTTTIQSFSLPVAPQTITCDNNNLFILAGSAPVIYQVEFL